MNRSTLYIIADQNHTQEFCTLKSTNMDIKLCEMFEINCYLKFSGCQHHSGEQVSVLFAPSGGKSKTLYYQFKEESCSVVQVISSCGDNMAKQWKIIFSMGIDSYSITEGCFSNRMTQLRPQISAAVFRQTKCKSEQSLISEERAHFELILNNLQTTPKMQDFVLAGVPTPFWVPKITIGSSQDIFQTYTREKHAHV